MDTKPSLPRLAKPKNPTLKSLGLNPKALGTNPRALGINPKALRTRLEQTEAALAAALARIEELEKRVESDSPLLGDKKESDFSSAGSSVLS